MHAPIFARAIFVRAIFVRANLFARAIFVRAIFERIRTQIGESSRGDKNTCSPYPLYRSPLWLGFGFRIRRIGLCESAAYPQALGLQVLDQSPDLFFFEA